MKTETTGMSTWQLQHAKNRFSEVVDRAIAGAPQWVTRRGKPAVCVVSASDYRELVARRGRSIKAVLRSSPHPDLAFDVARERTPGREVDL